MSEQPLNDKQKLEALAKHVHEALRMLKMGDVGTISCGKQFKMDEVWWYVIAYGIHKEKWFKMRKDNVSEVIFAERAEPPKKDKEEPLEEVQ